ncbi:MAG: hypothetical protein AAF721_33230, partial [Myxococcota bacterium]
DVSTCDISQGFVGLGGDGGYVIVSLGDALEAGDTLDTLEVGGCEFEGGSAIVDDFRVSVGVDSDINATWQLVAQGFGPSVSVTLSDADLPPVPAE